MNYFFYWLDFFLSTFAPFFRATERPVAIACFLLFAFFFDFPLCSLPFLAFFTARFTELLAFLPYLAIISLLVRDRGIPFALGPLK